MARRLLRETECSWLFWMDSDAFVHDQRRPLPLPRAHEHAHFVISTDWPNGGDGSSTANTGTFLVRRSEFGLRLLNAWHERRLLPNASKFPYDQHGLDALLRGPSWGDDNLGRSQGVARLMNSPRVHILPAMALNSEYGRLLSAVDRPGKPARPGWRGKFDPHFVVHLMAMDAETRLNAMRQWLETHQETGKWAGSFD